MGFRFSVFLSLQGDRGIQRSWVFKETNKQYKVTKKVLISDLNNYHENNNIVNKSTVIND